MIKRAVLLALLLVCPVDAAERAPTAPLTIEIDAMTCTGWAFEVLTPEVLEGTGTREKSVWHPDMRFPEFRRPDLADFVGRAKRGEDIGHGAPAGNYGRQSLIDATHTLGSNGGFQDLSLNRGPWNQIEQQTRSYVTAGAKVYVATGPLFRPGSDGTISVTTRGTHVIWKGTHYSKAVCIDRGNKEAELEKRFSTVAWCCPNEKPDGRPLDAYRVPVDEIEFYLGRDLFSWVPQPLQERLESTR